MSELQDSLSDEKIVRTYVLRQLLQDSKIGAVDIYAHESLLVQSESGKHRIYERWADGWQSSNAPSPVRGENTQPTTTRLFRKTELYRVGERAFHKQVHGQKVTKVVTFGDLNKFSANEKAFNEDYHFASNNCQDYQDRVRSELLGLPVDRPWRTAVTKYAVRFACSPQTRRDVRDWSYQTAFAGSSSLNKSSDSLSSHGIKFSGIPNPSSLPSSHDTSSHVEASATFPGNQVPALDDIIDGSLSSLFAECPPLSSYNTASASSSFAKAKAEYDAEAERNARRRVDQFQTHAPGLFGAAENVVNCFKGGHYFAGVWNTTALAWSCGVLCATGGAVSVTVEAPPTLDGPPRVRVAVVGVLSFG